MRTRHFLSVVAAATLWGGGGVTGVLLARHADIHPMSVAMWRMVVGGLALVIVLAVGRQLSQPLSRAAWVRVLVTGALTAVFESAFFTAITLSSVGLTTFIGIGSAPVFVGIYDVVVRRERPSPRTLIALALAMVGLALLLSGSLELGDNGVLGAGLALVTGAAFAGITVVNRTAVPDLSPLRLTAFTFAVGGVMLAPLAAFAGFGVPSDVTGWSLTLLLGLASTALAYIFFLTGLATVPPFVATIVTLLEPLIAAVLGAIILSESLGPLGVVGGLVLASAVVLLRPQRDEPETIH